MHKKLIGIIFILIITSSCSTYSMNNLPKGEFLKASSSPDGSYIINAYLCSGNATTDFSVRCETMEVSSGKTRNIYWEYHVQEADIQWKDSTTVIINGREFNILTDTYDWRRE